MSLDFVPVKPIRGGRPMDGLYNRLASDPLWVTQAKLNGIRALWDGADLWSRTGGRATYKLNSRNLAVLRRVSQLTDGELLPDGRYFPFDLPDHTGPLVERWAALEALAAQYDLTLCPTGVAWADVERLSWEGVVFKRLSSKYPKAYSEGKTTPDWVKYRAEWL